jgi:hypothetical protein
MRFDHSCCICKPHECITETALRRSLEQAVGVVIYGMPLKTNLLEHPRPTSNNLGIESCIQPCLCKLHLLLKNGIKETKEVVT